MLPCRLSLLTEILRHTLARFNKAITESGPNLSTTAFMPRGPRKVVVHVRCMAAGLAASVMSDQCTPSRLSDRLDSRARVVYVPTLYQWTADGSGQSISRVLSQRATIVELKLAVAGFMQSTANGYE